MIEPYKRHPGHRAVALMREDGRLLVEDGRSVAPWQVSDHSTVIYLDSARCSRLLTRGWGSAMCWAGDPIRYYHDGGEAIVLRSGIEVGDDEAFIEALAAWRDWVEAGGARVASIGSTAWSLMRATIPHPLATGAGEAPPIKVLIGGRQEMGGDAGTHRGDFTSWDLTAAYPQAMAGLHYGADWQRVPASKVDVPELVSRGWGVFARAKVQLGDMEVGPLPVRPVRERNTWEQVFDPIIYPRTGLRTGVWTGAELIAAAAAGATVKLSEVWSCGGEQVFAPFWKVGQVGRGLPGLAGRLAKMTVNALWGQFAIGREARQYLSFKDGRRFVAMAPDQGGRPRSFDLAESITGIVRSRLFAELLSIGGIITAHTDGGWSGGSVAPLGVGWRVKDRAEVMDVLNPQGYAYRRPQDKRVHYVMAGVPMSGRERAFAEIWKARYPHKVPGVFV